MISYENFDLRLRADGDGFVVSARHGALDASEPFEIDLSRSWELEELEKLGRDAVRQRGAELFDAVIRGRIRDLYYRAGGHAGLDGRAGLRIRIRFDPRDERLRRLVRLPWEIVLDRMADGGNPLAFDPRRAIVRVIDSVEQTLAPAKGPVERVLLALSNPVDSQRLDVEQECAAVIAALGRVDVSPLVLRKTTQSTLLATIADAEPQVVHFIGHGVFDEKAGEGALLLEDEFGLENRLLASILARSFMGKPMPRLAILSACLTADSGRGSTSGPFASMAVALVATGLPAVIAMQSKVRDRNAIHFTGGLYRCLARGGTIEAAVAEARASVAADRLGKLDWAAPVLFVRAHVPGPLLRRPEIVRAKPGELLREIERDVMEGRYFDAMRKARAIPAGGLSAGDRDHLKQILLEAFASLSQVPTNGYVEHVARSHETARALLLQATRQAGTDARKAMSTYDEIYSRFQRLPDAAVQEHVSAALAAWVDLGWHGLRDPAIDAVADVILARRARSLSTAEDVVLALMVKAELRLEASQFLAAIRLFDEVLAEKPGAEQLTRARIGRAQAFAGLGRTVSALAELSDVISACDLSEPRNASNIRDAYTLRALLLENSGRGMEALQDLDSAWHLLVAMSGETSAVALDAKMSKGATAERLGYHDEAAAEYRIVLERARGPAALAGYASRARHALWRLHNVDMPDRGGTHHGQ